MNYKIYPPEELIETTVRVPLSKSLSNRALIINALTPGAALLTGVAVCDDTRAVMDALRSGNDAINVGAAGTAMRFLTAYFAVQSGRTVTIDGTERMRQRPIGTLVDALRQCGATIEYLGAEGFPPLRITGGQLSGGVVAMDTSVSSQYVSALLMVAPLMTDGLKLELGGDMVSRPYVDMTIGLMRQGGAEVDVAGDVITVAAGGYSPVEFTIEGDWSAASYWYEVAAISSGFVTLEGLFRKSLQGDAHVAELFKVFGLQSEFGDEGELELMPTPDPGARLFTDLSDTPDLAQTLAVTCCLLSIPFNFTGLSTLKIKETDRLKALCDELLKLGFYVRTEGDDTLHWDGVRFPVEEIPAIDTYQDHRMAMAFAPVSLFVPGIVINDVDVVTKSYPGYWDDLRNAGFITEEL